MKSLTKDQERIIYATTGRAIDTIATKFNSDNASSERAHEIAGQLIFDYLIECGYKQTIVDVCPVCGTNIRT